jgi:hypothetical protein
MKTALNYCVTFSAGSRRAGGMTRRLRYSRIVSAPRIIKEAPTGQERANSFQRYQDHLDELAARVTDVLEDEIDASIDEAVRRVRHMPE